MQSNFFQLGLKLWSNSVSYLPDAIKLYKEKLYDYIELYIVPGSHQKFSDSFKALSIPFVLHCPHSGHGFNLADKTKEKQNLQTFIEVNQFAKELNAKKIIIHCGVNGHIKETKRQLKLINDERIVIENQPLWGMGPGKDSIFTGSTFEEIQELLKRNNLGFCLDIGHAKCTARILKIDPILYLKKFKELNPSLFHLSGGRYKDEFDHHEHLSDTDYPWKKILPLINEGYKITIETDKDLPDKLYDFEKDVLFFRKASSLGGEQKGKLFRSVSEKENPWALAHGSLLTRKAKNEDMMFLYNLRNDIIVRESAFNDSPIDLITHKSWFYEKIKSHDTVILIAEINNERVGQMRLNIDSKKKTAEVDIAICSNQRGKGYGSQLLISGCQYAIDTLDIRTLVAHIKPENQASLKSFAKAGFTNWGLVTYKSQKCIEEVFKKGDHDNPQS